MELDIQFPDFSQTTSLTNFVDHRLQSLEKRLTSRYKNPMVTVRGEVVARYPDGKPKKFMAELVVKLPHIKNPYIVKKENVDFRTAIVEATQVMEKILRRESKKAERGRNTVGKSLHPIREVKRTGQLPGKKNLH